MRKPASTRISATGRPESGKLPDSRELRNTWVLIFEEKNCPRSWDQTSLTSGSMWVRQDVRMTPPPNMVRQENRVTMVAVCKREESQYNWFLWFFFLRPAGFLSDAANPSGHPAVEERRPIGKRKERKYKVTNCKMTQWSKMWLSVVQLERFLNSKFQSDLKGFVNCKA